MKQKVNKICTFICSLGSGGAEHQLIFLCNMLAEKGYDVSIITWADIDDHYSYDCRIKRFRIAPQKNIIMKVLYIWKYFLSLNTDVLISFGQRENLLSIFPLLFRPRIKIIAGERNYTRGFTSLKETFLFKILYRRANYVVPNSNSQAKYIEERASYLKKKISVITNFADLNLFKVSAVSVKAPLRIGVFARYTRQKNYERFANAIKLMKSKYGCMFLIDWFGNMYDKDGRKSMDYLTFLDLIEKYDISDVIKLNDRVKNVETMLSKFDAISLPSLWEGFSNSISEAICCGKPMLVSDVSDNNVMVKDGVNGFLFNPYDENDICDAFGKFFNLSVDDIIKMGLKSREIAEELFNAENFVGKYIKIIEK